MSVVKNEQKGVRSGRPSAGDWAIRPLPGQELLSDTTPYSVQRCSCQPVHLHDSGIERQVWKSMLFIITTGY